jgi:hypothetical protein
MTDGTVGTPKSSASLNNKNWNSMNMFKIYTACSIANSSCIRFFFPNKPIEFDCFRIWKRILSK